MKLKYDAKRIRLAMTCQANQDTRYYLNGILLAANGDIVGTDGHKIAKTSSKVAPENDTIVRIEGKLLKTDKTIEFDFDTNLALVSNGKKVKTLHFEIVDGRYPDYSRVIPRNEDIKPTSTIGMNSAYLAQLAFFADYGNYGGVRMNLYSEHNSIKFEPIELTEKFCTYRASKRKNDTYESVELWPADTCVVIMPMRV